MSDPMIVDDPLEVYLREMDQVPPLSREEEIRCIEHVRAGDPMAESAASRLVETHLRLVVAIAERYKDDRIHILDLIVSGNNGLLRAVQTLSEWSHDSFSDYASDHIERAIKEATAALGSNNSR
jgi:DNA-directed RNA polymerase sigma subunit (sigma70/sigma32)